MKKLFLYPYTCAADSVIRQRELMEGCSLEIWMCLSGFALFAKKISRTEGD